tara:strand:+ start:279 stop:674 length:396 start_codon:yes stop_codon:yes gene_type:complete
LRQRDNARGKTVYQVIPRWRRGRWLAVLEEARCALGEGLGKEVRKCSSTHPAGLKAQMREQLLAKLVEIVRSTLRTLFQATEDELAQRWAEVVSVRARGLTGVPQDGIDRAVWGGLPEGLNSRETLVEKST